MALTNDQQHALEAMRSGKNILLTGDAGTGKSFVVGAFLEECQQSGKPVVAMAPTGVAALNLKGGSTIHRTLGLKPQFQSPGEKLKAPKVLKAAEIIVIDEFSMLRIDLFERVIELVRLAEKASGSKQLILIGDPFQLPPVVTREDRVALSDMFGTEKGFCFESRLWPSLELEPCVLHEIVRQKNDSELSKMLTLARKGDASCVEYFNQHALADRADAPDGAIWLCPRKKDVQRINCAFLDELSAHEHVFESVIEGTVNAGDKPTEDKLVLKVGARVMAVANDSGPMPEYVNGSIGTIVAINPRADRPVTVSFDDGAVVSFDYKEWDICKTVVTQDGIDQETGKPRTKITSEIVGTFAQIPLVLAWAMTIHKAQGKSFDEVCVETSVFADGQLYVGLSRATSFDGLHVYPKIEPSKLSAERCAINFYDDLMHPHEDVSESHEEVAAPVPNCAQIIRSDELAPAGHVSIVIHEDMLDSVIEALACAGISVS